MIYLEIHIIMKKGVTNMEIDYLRFAFTLISAVVLCVIEGILFFIGKSANLIKKEWNICTITMVVYAALFILGFLYTANKVGWNFVFIAQ